MPRTVDPALEEAGLSEEVVAASIARVFGLMIGQDESGDEAGWLGVVARASEIIGGDGDNDVDLFLPRFADTLRSAYGRAIDPDYQPAPAEGLTEEVRLGWQAVARHLTQVYAMDPKEARKLDQHEASIVAFVKTRSATPKV